MSGDPDQDYFADGLSEDLITGLAHIRWLFVIARNSTFVYKDRAVDVGQVSRELGVRYVLEGSVRRSGNRLRISAQLVDALTGAHHWAERYDRQLGDIFAVQDEITRSVAASDRAPPAGGRRRAHPFAFCRRSGCMGARRPRANTLLAADPRGLRSGCRTAEARRRKPILTTRRLEVCWLSARCLLPIWAGSTAKQGLLPGRQQAIRAIALDDRHPWGHIALAYWAMMERRTEESIAAFRRAVILNPNSAAAHSHLSRGLAFAGHDREAIEHGEEAIRLSPLDPEMALFLGAIAVAHYTAGRYAEAIERSLEAQRLASGISRVATSAVREPGTGWARRRGPVASGHDTTRAAAAVARLDQGECSLPDARADGALPGRLPKSGAGRGIGELRRHRS